MTYPNAIARAKAVPAWSTSISVLAAEAELAVTNEPKPNVVRAAAASASSISVAPKVETVLVSTLSEFKLVKFASTSEFVRGEPLPDLVVIVAIGYAPSTLTMLTT
tara:strand:- start:2 stop:319 length:318 start_codon:yes stop_codon:yes gene_type:complete